jgi:hypothetical protein
MSWFKVDDGLWKSTKRLMASTSAMGLWVNAGSWSRDHKTGGYIPREALRQIATDLSFEEAEALAAELVEAKMPGLHEHGFWVPVANGWQFHDWEEMQPEDELEAHRREKIRQVRSEAGLRGAQARWQTNGKNCFANGNGESPGSRARPRVGSPTPSPSGSDPSRLGLLPGLGSELQQASDSKPKDLAGSARVDGESAQANVALATKSPFKSDEEREVFEHWATKLWPLVHQQGREPRATGPRLSRIRGRLSSGYAASDLKLVIDRVATSRFHLGDNESGKPYIEPKTIFRSDETVDDWLSKKAGGMAPSRAKGTPTQPNYGTRPRVREL